jgi:hypothetical protein
MAIIGKSLLENEKLLEKYRISDSWKKYFFDFTWLFSKNTVYGSQTDKKMV